MKGTKVNRMHRVTRIVVGLKRYLLGRSVLATERVLDVAEHVLDRIQEWGVLRIEEQNHFHC